jgi:hypothetical protein
MKNFEKIVYNGLKFIFEEELFIPISRLKLIE